MPRATPFDLVFSEFAPERFPPLREALDAAGTDPRDRDGFLVTLPAMTLLRDMRPADADAGSGIEELTALLHHAFLAWDAGLPTWTLPTAPLRTLLGRKAAPATAPATPGYLQFPERVVWASLTAPGPWEPLDGCFVHAAADGALRVLGVFGMHPGRDGFTVAEATGRPGAIRTRQDGTSLFAPTLEGGAEAGLYALVERGELVELTARALADPALAATSGEKG